MTCTEAIDLLPAAVDGQIREDILSKLHLHLGECSPCLHEFELERLTKNVVRKYSPSAPPPSGLRESVLHKIRLERHSAPPEHNFISRIRSPRFVIFGLSGAAAAIALLMIFTPARAVHHSHTQPADADVVHQTYNNFDRVLDGNMRPEIVSDDPEKIRAFFSPMVDFNVQIPSMRQFKLVGALCSQYNGKCIAQLVYRGSKDVVYVYEVSMRSASASNSAFAMSPAVASQLKETGWYVEHHVPDCSLAMWVVDSTLCCAVADVNKDLLLASLTESPESPESH